MSAYARRGEFVALTWIGMMEWKMRMINHCLHGIKFERTTKCQQ